MFNPSQINRASAALGQGLVWDGSKWAPAAVLINPMTTTGDLITRNGGVPVRVGIGSTGQLLGISAGLPAWVTLASTGLSDSSVLVRTSSTYADPSWITSLAGSKVSGAVATATALAANPANCSAGTFPLGVDASGNAENCTALPTTIAGTANQITASAATGAITLSFPAGGVTLPGTTTGTFSGNLTGNVTGNVSGSSGSTTGNAATATVLQTARTIAGVSFDGTANISLASTGLSDSASLVRTSSTYANPSWLTSLAGTKITTPVANASAMVTGFVPLPTLRIAAGATATVYGDSITQSTGWFETFTGEQGWTANNQAAGGAALYDQCQNKIWGSTVNSTTVSFALLGLNDGGNTTTHSTMYRAAMGACYLWLVTPSKQFGNTLTTSGTWTSDSILASGIRTTGNGATATGSVFGSTVYVVSRSLTTNNPTFTVTVDGVAYGPYTTAASYTTNQGSNFSPYLVRIPNLENTHHTVVVTNSGTGQLHVDFITGNVPQISSTGPFLWVGTIPKTASLYGSFTTNTNTIIRGVVSDLAADGLGVALVDVEAACTNPTARDQSPGNGGPANGLCSLSDGTHPDAGGIAIIADAFRRAVASTGSFPGRAATATALAANPSNCSAGSFPLGIAANGSVESCTALPTSIVGTANQIAASAATGTVTLSFPGAGVTLPGTTSVSILSASSNIQLGSGVMRITGSEYGLGNGASIGWSNSAVAQGTKDVTLTRQGVNVMQVGDGGVNASGDIAYRQWIGTARAFADLGSPSNGAQVYCSNCTKATPCASGGTGAFAKRLNGAWDCN
jgi:hypothetical protein